MKKKIIYSSELRDYQSEEVRKDYQTCYGYTEEEMEDFSEEDMLNFVMSENENWLYDEEGNLNKQLDNNIIVIAKLGLWNGLKSGYKIITDNLNGILSCCVGDSYEVYCDAYNVRATDTHHDGTNTYLFREVKEGVNIEAFKQKILNGEHTSKDISRYTRSLKPYLQQIYGF